MEKPAAVFSLHKERDAGKLSDYSPILILLTAVKYLNVSSVVKVNIFWVYIYLITIRVILFRLT